LRALLTSNAHRRTQGQGYSEQAKSKQKKPQVGRSSKLSLILGFVEDVK
jgi:hypothetical protein